jgi:hypothetical protein
MPAGLNNSTNADLDPKKKITKISEMILTCRIRNDPHAAEWLWPRRRPCPHHRTPIKHKKEAMALLKTFWKIFLIDRAAHRKTEKERHLAERKKSWSSIL